MRCNEAFQAHQELKATRVARGKTESRERTQNWRTRYQQRCAPWLERVGMWTVLLVLSMLPGAWLEGTDPGTRTGFSQVIHGSCVISVVVLSIHILGFLLVFFGWVGDELLDRLAPE